MMFERLGWEFLLLCNPPQHSLEWSPGETCVQIKLTLIDTRSALACRGRVF